MGADAEQHGATARLEGSDACKLHLGTDAYPCLLKQLWVMKTRAGKEEGGEGEVRTLHSSVFTMVI